MTAKRAADASRFIRRALMARGSLCRLARVLLRKWPMRVYVLRIEGRARLAQAFEHLMDHPEVASCAIEPEHSQLRFIAIRSAGDALVERIYEEGGLAWCTRHAFTPSEG